MSANNSIISCILKKTRPKRPNSFGPTMRANQAIKKTFFSFLFFVPQAREKEK